MGANVTTQDELRQRAKEYAARFKPAVRIQYAVLGDGAGNVEVANRPGWVWVRIGGETGRLTQAINKRAPLINNYPVSVGYEETGGRDLHVLAINDRAFPASTPWDGGGNVKTHAASHMFPDGADIVWVNKQQILPLLALPTVPPSTSIYINPDSYEGFDSIWYYYPGEIFGLSTYLPTTETTSRVTILYLDPADGLVKALSGPDFTGWVQNIFPMIPMPPARTIPIVAVLLHDTTTQIVFDNLYDVRKVFSSPGLTDHGNLLGLSDDDHPQYVLRALLTTKGDIPIFNTAWQRLPISATASDYMGIVSGGPAWRHINTLDHGGLLGLGDDDHTQYVLKTILTANGDLFVRIAGVVARKAVGAIGNVLTVSGASMPEWAAPSGGPGGGRPILEWVGV